MRATAVEWQQIFAASARESIDRGLQAPQYPDTRFPAPVYQTYSSSDSSTSPTAHPNPWLSLSLSSSPFSLLAFLSGSSSVPGRDYKPSTTQLLTKTVMETFPRKTQERQQLKANDDDNDAPQYLCEEEKRESEECESERERASEGHTKERRRGRGSLGRPPPVPGRRRGRAGWLGPAAGRSKQNKRDAPQLRHSCQNLRKSILSLFFSFPPPPPPFFLGINQSSASVVATYPYFWAIEMRIIMDESWTY